MDQRTIFDLSKYSTIHNTITQDQAIRALRHRKSLESIPEALQPLNDLPASRGPLVRALELPLQRQRDDDDERVGGQAGVHARVIARLGVLGAEDGAADDAAEAAGADESRGAEGALPLACGRGVLV